MAITYYDTGTISLTNGSAVVTGTGTGWQTALISGGVIYPQAPGGNPLPIKVVDSNTKITAAIAWTGATGPCAYAIARQDDVNQVLRNAQALSQYIQELDNPALGALAALTPAADRLPFFNGAGTADLTILSAFARQFLDDANGPAVYGTLGAIPEAQVPALSADKAYRRGNVLGTVSQSGGVPVGALIEMGGNPASGYARFAGGLQIAWRNTGTIPSESLALGNIFRGTTYDLGAFAAAFQTAPATLVTGTGSAGGGWIAQDLYSTQTGWGSFSARSATGIGGNVNFYGFAVGRWY